MIYFNCSKCSQKMRTDDSCSGKVIRCPKCGQTMRVPASAAASAARMAGDYPEIIKFRCPTCNQKIGLDKSYAGKTVRCAKCKNPIVVPLAALGQAERPPDIDLLPIAGDAKIPQSKEPGEADFPGDDLLSDALLSSGANAPDISPPGPSSDEEPLKLAADEPKEQPTVQKRCPRCNSMNPPDAHVCSVCAFELAVPKAKAGRASTGTNRPILAAGLALLSTLLVLFVIWTIGSAVMQIIFGSGPRKGEARTFAIDYIEMLKNNDITKAKKLLNPQLQRSITDDQLHDISEFINKTAITNINLLGRHYEPNEQGDRYYVFFTISSGKLPSRRVAVSLRDDKGNFMVDGVATNDSGDSVAIGPRKYIDLVPILMEGELGTFFKAIMIVRPVFFVMTIIILLCKWIVFHKAGQPGWAAIIPIYNTWVLAVIGDKPGWFGLVAVFTNLIPFIGPVVSLILMIIIYISVAKSFNRSALFGIGLAFLPFIFYPFLAFASD